MKNTVQELVEVDSYIDKEEVDYSDDIYIKPKQVSGFKWSNCLIQALWHKLLHPFKTKIIYISAKINCVKCPHWFWSDKTGDYDFAPVDSDGACIVWFKGYIRKREKGFATKYKKMRKEKCKTKE